jgi:hypothetical protein
MKASNKLYLPDAPVDPIKIMRREQGQSAAHGTDTLRGQGMRAIQNGQQLRLENITAGNCWEMSCVAISLLAEQPFLSKINLFVCMIDRPADHVFVIVGGGHQFGETIQSLWLNSVSPTTDETYVVDVWAGICCKPADYYAEFLAKVEKWTNRRKVVHRGAGEWVLPAGDYQKQITQSPFVMHLESIHATAMPIY